MSYEITKAVAEIYRIRGKHGEWADITLDVYEHSGRLSISSDYGDWACYWGASGPFKEFLTKLNIDYVAGKFGCNRRFDHARTIEGKKKEVLQARRDGDISYKVARSCWNEIEELMSYTDEGGYVVKAWQAKALNNILETGPNVVTRIDPQFKTFWDTLWQVFVEELKREMSEYVANQ